MRFLKDLWTSLVAPVLLGSFMYICCLAASDYVRYVWFKSPGVDVIDDGADNRADQEKDWSGKPSLP